MRWELTNMEEEIMKAVWELSDAGETANTYAIRKKVSSWRGEKIYGQSVYTYAAKLERLGYVRLERGENDRIVVIPLVSREDYMLRLSKAWAEFWNKSDAGCAMMMLNHADAITEEEKEELRRFLDELD